MIKGSIGSLIHSHEYQLERWVDDFMEPFIWSFFTMDILFQAESKTMQADISPSLEMEVITKIGSLKRLFCWSTWAVVDCFQIWRQIFRAEFNKRFHELEQINGSANV